MTFIQEICDDNVRSHVLANYPKIAITPGKCRYNFRCQMNAVHDAIEKNHSHIAMVVVLEDGKPYIHFVNKKKSGIYVDNTLGHWSEYGDYHLVRLIEKDSFYRVNKIFAAYRDELRRLSPWYLRMFCNRNY